MERGKGGNFQDIQPPGGKGELRSIYCTVEAPLRPGIDPTLEKVLVYCLAFSVTAEGGGEEGDKSVDLFLSPVSFCGLWT